MNGVQIRVGDLLYAIGKRWKMILAFVLVGCGFGAALSGISYVQGNYTNYRINCSIAVTSQSETGNFTGNSSYFNPNDFYLAQDMVDAVGYVMKSERVLREAAESVRIVDPDPVAIARNLDIERYNETQIIEISLKWHDADTGIRLMNAILDTSREVLPKTLMVGSVSTIDEPQAEYIMGMGGLSHIWLITGVMGFIMGAGMAMLELIMRPTLLNLKDVENVFGLETMGIIPNDQEYFRDGRVILEKDGMTDSAVRQNFTSAAYILQNRLGLKDETCSFYVTSVEAGTIEALSTWIGSNVPKPLVPIAFCLVGAIMSFFSSTTGVVAPALFPLIPNLAASVGLSAPVLFACTILGAQSSAISPFSSGGSLILGSTPKEEERNELFNRLLMVAVPISVITCTIYNFVIAMVL